MSRGLEWVFRLMDGRLWKDKPVVVGAMFQVRRIYGTEEVGTEVILKRSGA